MIKAFALRCTLLALALSGFAAYSQDGAPTESPGDVVHGAAEIALQAMDGRREYLGANPAELRMIVDAAFRPRFDTNYAAYLVLGRHGRTASAEQRRRFTAALYNYILNRYAQGLLRFDADRLQILPYQGEPGEDRATVRTFVTLEDGEKIPVNYDLRLGDGGWKVYDVIIEGISYVRNLRSQLGSEIEQQGLDNVILRLESYRSPDADEAA
jgi:phospholipid transport system substrate-binding protein